MFKKPIVLLNTYAKTDVLPINSVSSSLYKLAVDESSEKITDIIQNYSSYLSIQKQGKARGAFGMRCDISFKEFHLKEIQVSCDEKSILICMSGSLSKKYFNSGYFNVVSGSLKEIGWFIELKNYLGNYVTYVGDLSNLKLFLFNDFCDQELPNTLSFNDPKTTVSGAT